jgi:hypothetical protein
VEVPGAGWGVGGGGAAMLPRSVFLT